MFLFGAILVYDWSLPRSEHCSSFSEQRPLLGSNKAQTVHEKVIRRSTVQHFVRLYAKVGCALCLFLSPTGDLPRVATEASLLGSLGYFCVRLWPGAGLFRIGRERGVEDAQINAAGGRR